MVGRALRSYAAGLVPSRGSLPDVQLTFPGSRADQRVQEEASGAEIGPPAGPPPHAPEEGSGALPFLQRVLAHGQQPPKV